MSKLLRQVRWHRLESTPSTQTLCKDLLKDASAAEDLIVMTNRQTAGLTQDKKSRWVHFDRSVAMTLGLALNLRDSSSWQVAPLLQLVGPLALVQLLKDEAGLRGGDPKIKWPNDVHFRGRKVCGTLTELVPKHDGFKYDRVLVGMGINIASDTLEDTNEEFSFLPASVKQEEMALGVYKRIVRYLDLYEHKDAQIIFQEITTDVERNLLWVGERVQLFNKGELEERKVVHEGILLGINEAAGVNIKTDKGMIQVKVPMTMRPLR